MKRSQIEGLAALIVGGGSGMGAACARTFAANDGLVIVADLNLENAERVASEIRESGGKASRDVWTCPSEWTSIQQCKKQWLPMVDSTC